MISDSSVANGHDKVCAAVAAAAHRSVSLLAQDFTTSLIEEKDRVVPRLLIIFKIIRLWMRPWLKLRLTDTRISMRILTRRRGRGQGGEEREERRKGKPL
jgi:hypothetical protein